MLLRSLCPSRSSGAKRCRGTPDREREIAVDHPRDKLDMGTTVVYVGWIMIAIKWNASSVSTPIFGAGRTWIYPKGRCQLHRIDRKVKRRK